MLVTLFKATNQPIGLCSAILSLCHLTVNGIKKCYFSLGADLLKAFHLLSRYLMLECYKKKLHSLYKCRFLHAQFAWLLIWMNVLRLNTGKWEKKDNFCVYPLSQVSPWTLREGGTHFWGWRLSLWTAPYLSLSSCVPMRANANNELLSDASRNERCWKLWGFGESSWIWVCGTHHCWLTEGGCEFGESLPCNRQFWTHLCFPAGWLNLIRVYRIKPKYPTMLFPQRGSLQNDLSKIISAPSNYYY